MTDQMTTELPALAGLAWCEDRAAWTVPTTEYGRGREALNGWHADAASSFIVPAARVDGSDHRGGPPTALATGPDHAPKHAVDKDGLVRRRAPAAIVGGAAASEGHPNGPDTPNRLAHHPTDDEPRVWREVPDEIGRAVQNARSARADGTARCDTLDRLADRWVAAMGHVRAIDDDGTTVPDIESVVTGGEHIAHHNVIRVDVSDIGADTTDDDGERLGDPSVLADHHDTLHTSAARELGQDAADHLRQTIDLPSWRPVRRPRWARRPDRSKLPALRVRKAEQNQPTIQRLAYRSRRVAHTVTDRAVIIDRCTCDKSTATPHRHVHVVAPDTDANRERVTVSRHAGQAIRNRPNSRTRIGPSPRIDVRSLADEHQLADIIDRETTDHRRVRIVRNGRPVTVTRQGTGRVAIGTDPKRYRPRAAARIILYATT